MAQQLTPSQNDGFVTTEFLLMLPEPQNPAEFFVSNQHDGGEVVVDGKPVNHLYLTYRIDDVYKKSRPTVREQFRNFIGVQ